MTTEEDFQRQLDLHPDDHHTRLVFADWLEERGDVRAEGYRALGVGCLYPFDNTEGARRTDWLWFCTDVKGPHPTLPRDWLWLMNGNSTSFWPAPDHCVRRRAAEDAAATAFAKLPEARRAELLNPHPAGAL